MRFDTPIYFQMHPEGTYDEATGNYIVAEPVETLRYADITNTGVNTLQIVYGELKQGSKTVRIQGNYTDPFDHIRIGTKKYKVDFSRRLHNKETFVVSEVQ